MTMQRRSALKSIAGYALLAPAIGSFSACSESKPQFSSVDLTGADYAKDFALSDQDGKPRSLKDFQGKVVALFFGYTQCPDVCPTTMTELAQTKQLLGADGDKLQVLFVTVDPQRDTPEVLKAYMGNFDPTFLALRGTPDELAAMAKDYKVYYKKTEG
jgi:protein SCO1/2